MRIVLGGLLARPDIGTKTELGRRLGVSQSAITQILGEKNKPYAETARAIGKLAGLHPDFWRDDAQPSGASVTGARSTVSPKVEHMAIDQVRPLEQSSEPRKRRGAR